MRGCAEKIRKPLTGAQQKDVLECERRAWQIAHRFARCFRPYREYYDQVVEQLHAAGMVGLCIAATKFKPGKGVKFLTYADYWIRQSIQREFPYIHEISPSHGRCRVRVPANRIFRIGSSARDVSFDDSDEFLFDPPSRDMPSEVDDPDLAVLIARMIPDRRARRVMLWIIVDGLTYDAVAKRIGVSRERVRQIRNAELKRLRAIPRLRQALKRLTGF